MCPSAPMDEHPDARHGVDRETRVSYCNGLPAAVGAVPSVVNRITPEA
jgi:hypothetical protein